MSYRSVNTALASVGRLADWLRTSPSGRERVAPPPRLSRAWLLRADDDSPEFRVAAALAGLGIPLRRSRTSSEVPATRAATANAPPMAAHLAPLTNGSGEGFEARTFFRGTRLRRRRIWATDPSPPTVVWGHGGLVRNMIAVLERRLLEASVRGLADKPLASASFARLSDVSAFLGGDFDDARCSALLAGMVWAHPVWLPGARPEATQPTTTLPFAYAAIKPIFSTNGGLVRTGALSPDSTVPIPPGLIGRLRRRAPSKDGRVIDLAVRAAFARARSSGLPSPYDPVRSEGRAAVLGTGRIGVGVQPDRLAAALLIPVADQALQSLLRRAFPGTIHDTHHPQEEEKNVH